MTMTTPLLELKDVYTGYGNIEALKGVSLVVYPGEIVTIIGANGAGKSTALMSICQVVPLKAGEIFYNGAAIHGKPADTLPQLGLCQVPEGRRIFPRLSVEDNLEMGAFFRRDPSGIATDMARMFKLFPVLEERRKQLGGTLSGGEQQRVAIARAILNDPILVLADEPTGNLDPETSGEILTLLKKINKKGTAVLVVTHNYELVKKANERIIKLEDGRALKAKIKKKDSD